MFFQSKTDNSTIPGHMCIGGRDEGGDGVAQEKPDLASLGVFWAVFSFGNQVKGGLLVEGCVDKGLLGCSFSRKPRKTWFSYRKAKSLGVFWAVLFFGNQVKCGFGLLFLSETRKTWFYCGGQCF